MGPSVERPAVLAKRDEQKRRSSTAITVKEQLWLQSTISISQPQFLNLDFLQQLPASGASSSRSDTSTITL
ncbi:hypothetical protein ACMYSQ_005469 [Aspergillus niger]